MAGGTFVGEVTKIDRDGDVWFEAEGETDYVGPDYFKDTTGVEAKVGIKVVCEPARGCGWGLYLKGLAEDEK